MSASSGYRFACAWLLTAIALSSAEVAGAQSEQGQTLTVERRTRLISSILESRELRALAGEGRVRVVAVYARETKKGGASVDSQGLEFEAIVATYARSGGVRVATDADGRVLSAERLPGRPQSSEEERREAEEILSRSDQGRGFRAVGGFAVDPPPGAPPGRYLEFHLMGQDPRVIERGVILDLASGKIFEDRRN